MVTADELLKRVGDGKEKRRQEEEERCRQREERIPKRALEEAGQVRPKFLELIRKAADEGRLGCSFSQSVKATTDVPEGGSLVFREIPDDEEGRVRREVLKILAAELRDPSSGLAVEEHEGRYFGGYESDDYPHATYTLTIRWGEVEVNDVRGHLGRYPDYREGIWGPLISKR